MILATTGLIVGKISPCKYMHATHPAFDHLGCHVGY
jgi:hypothetical protein